MAWFNAARQPIVTADEGRLHHKRTHKSRKLLMRVGAYTSQSQDLSFVLASIATLCIHVKWTPMGCKRPLPLDIEGELGAGNSLQVEKNRRLK